MGSNAGDKPFFIEQSTQMDLETAFNKFKELENKLDKLKNDTKENLNLAYNTINEALNEFWNADDNIRLALLFTREVLDNLKLRLGITDD
jgi:predicted translin family RNA/ssDNA-binding protein